MDRLEELVERIEQATEPMRGLDAAIAIAVGAEHGEKSGFSNSHNGDYYVIAECAAPYTTSIDAALTLVPEGWAIGSLEWWPMRKSAGITLLETSEHENNGWPAHGYDHKVNANARASAATPALTICAAALRARLSVGEGEG